MLNRQTIVYILFLSLFLASPAFGLDIQLKSQVLVTKNTIRLGDIASITPENEEAGQWAERRVTHAPAPGTSKIIQAASVIDSLRYIPGADTIRWSGARNITVRRQGIEISREQIKQIIADFLHRNMGRLPDAQLRFTSVRAPEKIILPTGELTYRVTPSKPGILGSSSFSIIFQIDGKTVENCTVRGKLEALADVVTARVNMRKGTIITADQLTISRQDISRLDRPYPAIDLVTGMQVKRTIRAGKAVDNRNVELPPLVKKGEPVKIIAAKGALQISTNGIAVMDGRRGDFIRVKNMNSSKLLYCKVDSPGIVSVEF